MAVGAFSRIEPVKYGTRTESYALDAARPVMPWAWSWCMLFVRAAVSAKTESWGAHSCAACVTLNYIGHENCGMIESLCDLLPAAVAGCEKSGMCEKVTPIADRAPVSPIQLRVANGFGGARPYGSLRVSVITPANEKPKRQFDYSGRFVHRWTQYALSSSVVQIPPGVRNFSYSLGNVNATLWLPNQGDGVAGVLIADPCVRFTSVISLVACSYSEKFRTAERTAPMLNAFLKHEDTDFWGVLGDNWYDRDGAATARVYSQFELAALQKIFMTVPGNHDYWVLGNPRYATTADQFANGFHQYYAQDTFAARHVPPGSALQPFNLSVDPGAGHRFLGGNLPDLSNSLFYHQIGNVGFIGYSSAYDAAQLLSSGGPMAEACAWLPQQYGLRIVMLIGHWDKANMGATSANDVPGLYEHIRTLPGCKAFDDVGMLKFFQGHTHCNEPHPHGHLGKGFMVAGQGMEVSPRYLPAPDTTHACAAASPTAVNVVCCLYADGRAVAIMASRSLTRLRTGCACGTFPLFSGMRAACHPPYPLPTFAIRCTAASMHMAGENVYISRTSG